MSEIVIKVEKLSKQYKLGDIGTGSISHDLNRWWHSVRGKEDPYLKIGEENNKQIKGSNNYVWALKDIDFCVQKGEVLGIIGKNGAGKSTLLKILSRTTSPTSGQIKLNGRVASLLEVGTGFHPELTGRDNIFLNGAILGMNKTEIRRKFDEIVEFSGVERYIDTPVKRYSSGMYVRLAFAVAAHLEPEILIVDEVLAVGDAEFQKRCLGKMKAVSIQDGRTVLFVSHNMLAVQSLCTKGILLKNGKIETENKINDVIQQYNNDTGSVRNISLESRTDRSGNGNIIVRAFEFRDQNDKKTSTITTGEDVKLILFCKGNGIIELRNVLVAIGIDDIYGTRITHINNQLTNQIISKVLRGEFLIEIQISRLPLMPGRYDMTLFVQANGEVTDWIQNAISFIVEAGDYYNTGKLIPEGQGIFLMNYNFKFYDGFC